MTKLLLRPNILKLKQYDTMHIVYKIFSSLKKNYQTLENRD